MIALLSNRCIVADRRSNRGIRAAWLLIAAIAAAAAAPLPRCVAQETGPQEVDKQAVDKQAVDKQAVDKQAVDKQAANKLAAEAVVLQYLDELDAASADTRQSAESKVIAMGLIALPAVRAAFEDGKYQGEQELRLAKIFQELQKLEVRRQLEPTTVTMQGLMPVADVAAAIQKQTGNAVELENLQNAAPVIVETDFEETVFWEAVDTLCDDADLDLDPFRSIGKVVLEPTRNLANLRLLRGQYSGPFRIEASNVVATRSFDLPVLDSLRIGMQVAWEPRLRPLSMRLDKEELTAVCDDGSVLELLPDSAAEIATAQSIASDFEISLRLPPREATKINRLSGSLDITLASEPVSVRFADLSGELPVKRQVGDLVASVEAVRKNGAVSQVDLLMELDRSELRLDSFRNWLQPDSAHLIDPSGQKVDSLGWQTYAMNEKEVGVTINFQTDSPIEQCQFIFAAPVAVVEHSVEFLLEDVPLP